MTFFYARGTGFGSANVVLFMATAGLAGAVARWPIGSLLDRLGRRFFPAGGTFVSAAFGIASATTNTDQTILLCAFLAIFGAAASFSIGLP